MKTVHKMIYRTIYKILILSLFTVFIISCKNEVDLPDDETKVEQIYTLMDDPKEMLSPLEESYLRNRDLERLVIHCTGQDIRNPYTVKTLTQYFLVYMKWSKVGYTFFIDRDGRLWKLNEDWNWDEIVDYGEITYGARGYNSTSLHIVWDGGTYKGKIEDNRTPEQKITLEAFVFIFKDKFPRIDVIGHRDLSPDINGDGIIDSRDWLKQCPVFDVRREYGSLLGIG